MVLEKKDGLFYYKITTFFYFAVAGIVSTFYYPFLRQAVGLSLSEVGRITSFGAAFSLIVQPLISHFFGKAKDKKLFMCVYFLSLAVLCLLFFSVEKSWIYLFAAFYGCIGIPLIGTYEIYLEKVAGTNGFSYAKVRKWGSLGMGALTFLGGSLISIISFRGLHSLGILLLLACLLLVGKKFAPVWEQERRKKARLAELFTNPRVWVLYVMSFLGIGSYVGCDFAFSSYLTRITGSPQMSNQLFSLSSGMKIVSEFLMFTLIGKFLKNHDRKRMLIFVFLVSLLRFLCISTGLLPVVILGDLLHGIVFPLFLTVIFEYLHFVASEELVSGCYGVISMLMFGFSNFIFPPLFSLAAEQLGYASIYLINAGLAAATATVGLIFLAPAKKEGLRIH